MEEVFNAFMVMLRDYLFFGGGLLLAGLGLSILVEAIVESRDEAFFALLVGLPLVAAGAGLIALVILCQ